MNTFFKFMKYTFFGLTLLGGFYFTFKHFELLNVIPHEEIITNPFILNPETAKFYEFSTSNLISYLRRILSMKDEEITKVISDPAMMEIFKKDWIKLTNSLSETENQFYLTDVINKLKFSLQKKIYFTESQLGFFRNELALKMVNLSDLKTLNLFIDRFFETHAQLLKPYYEFSNENDMKETLEALVKKTNETKIKSPKAKDYLLQLYLNGNENCIFTPQISGNLMDLYGQKMKLENLLSSVNNKHQINKIEIGSLSMHVNEDGIEVDENGNIIVQKLLYKQKTSTSSLFFIIPGAIGVVAVGAYFYLKDIFF